MIFNDNIPSACRACPHNPNGAKEKRYFVTVRDYQENEYARSYIVDRKQLNILKELTENDILKLMSYEEVDEVTDMT